MSSADQSIESVSGNNNIIVQANGSQVVVHGRPYLELHQKLRRHTPKPNDRNSELTILHAHKRAIELVGREDDLAKLQGWLFGPAKTGCPHNISVRTVIGRAGTGKTRIGLALVDLLGEGELKGTWHSGFIDRSELERFYGNGNLGSWGWARPTLIIIDYADTMATTLSKWLIELSRSTQEKPLRLLLLARQAEVSEGWYQNLRQAGDFSDWDAIGQLFDPIEPERLAPLDSPEQRREVLRATLDCLPARPNKPKPQLPPHGTDRQFDDRLKAPIWAEPLYLMMAALTALDRDFFVALSFSRTDLGHFLAQKELSRIGKFAATEPEKNFLKHLAACVTLLKSVTGEEALQLIEEEASAFHVALPHGANDIRQHLHAALPGPDEGASGIQPDLIGEALILNALGECQKSLTAQQATVVRLARRNTENVLESLIRASQNFGHDSTLLLHPLKLLDALIRSGETDNPSLLFQIFSALPESTTILREAALATTKLLVDRIAKYREQFSEDEAEGPYASVLSSYSNRLSEVGRREDALAAAEEALVIRRKLAHARPDAFEPALAGCLNNYGNMLSEVGRREDALAATEEALAIYGKLAQARPDAFEPDLAMSLNNYGTRLSAVGRREDALAAAEDALVIRRKLAQARPDAFELALASSLNNYGNMLSEVGRREDALAATEEALVIRRKLAQARPDAFEPDLATILNNYGTMLSEVRRREDALAAAEEALVIRRKLAQTRPDAFEPALATSLNNYGTMLSEVGRREDALAATKEALAIYRKLAQARPDAFEPDLAMSLNNYGTMLSAVGRPEDALAAAEEALATYRKLAQGRSETFSADLAISCGSFGSILMANAQPSRAASVFHEGIESVSTLFQKMPKAVAGLTEALCRDYINATEAAGQQPDLDLLLPIITIFEKTKNQSREGE